MFIIFFDELGYLDLRGEDGVLFSRSLCGSIIIGYVYLELVGRRFRFWFYRFLYGMILGI